MAFLKLTNKRDDEWKDPNKFKTGTICESKQGIIVMTVSIYDERLQHETNRFMNLSSGKLSYEKMLARELPEETNIIISNGDFKDGKK